MNTNMAGFRWFSKNLGILMLWMKVASALEGLRQINQVNILLPLFTVFLQSTFCSSASTLVLLSYNMAYAYEVSVCL